MILSIGAAARRKCVWLRFPLLAIRCDLAIGSLGIVADLALLQPHLQPVGMALLKDMERPHDGSGPFAANETPDPSLVRLDGDDQRDAGLYEGDDWDSRCAGRGPVATFHSAA